MPVLAPSLPPFVPPFLPASLPEPAPALLLGASLLALAIGLAVGSLPLGARLIHSVSGRDPRDLNPHMLGVENAFRLLGAPLALAAFALDVSKGAAALLLAALLPFEGAPAWAAVGVYLGHLWPLPLLGFDKSPRGRGNGVLLGVLAGWHLLGVLPLLAAALTVAAYAAALALTRYAAVATLAGLGALLLALPGAALLAGARPAPLPALAVTALVVLALWRQKAALARILDGTEPRFGEPPAVRGLDPGVVLAAFMIHPMTEDDLWQPRSQRGLEWLKRHGLLSSSLLRRLLLHVRPIHVDTLSGVRLEDGRELRVLLIGAPMLPDQIRAHPDLATELAVQGARLARELGAEAFGLGAFWSTVGDKGRAVQAAVPEIVITNGGAYTAATVRAAVPGLLRRFEAEGGTLRRATAAVVGANGVVAFGVARTLAPEVGELILVGRDAARLARSAATLRRKFPDTAIFESLDVADVQAADIVFSATSHPEPVIFAEHVKPGAWIYDLGRPADVDEGVRAVPGVQLIPGGVVRPPGTLRCELDMHFGEGLIPACLAETMVMTATRAFDRASLGQRTRSADLEFYLREGARLGFEVVTGDERVADLEEVS